MRKDALGLMIVAIEGLAVLMALWMVFGPDDQTLEDRVGLLQLIGLFVLIAWVGRRLRTVAYVFGAIVEVLIGLVFNTAPRQSALYREMQMADLCRRHYLALKGLIYTVSAVGIAVPVVFAMHSFDEYIPNLATIWFWAYRMGLLVAGVALVGMIGVVLHARPRCVARSVRREGQRSTAGDSNGRK